MPRPTQNNCEYFPHRASFRHRRELKALEYAFREKINPQAGYAFFVKFREILTEADGNEWLFCMEEVEMLTAELFFSVEQLIELISFSIRIGLLVIDEDNFISDPELNQDLEPVWRNRKRERKPSTFHNEIKTYKSGNYPKPAVQRLNRRLIVISGTDSNSYYTLDLVSVPETTEGYDFLHEKVHKGKERKGKERKEEESYLNLSDSKCEKNSKIENPALTDQDQPELFPQEEKEKSSTKKEKEKKLSRHLLLRNTFMNFYKEQTGFDYMINDGKAEYGGKDDSHLSNLRKLLEKEIIANGADVTDEIVVTVFDQFLRQYVTAHPWVIKNLSISNIYSKYNEIKSNYSNGKSTCQKGKSSISKDYKADIANRILGGEMQ